MTYNLYEISHARWLAIYRKSLIVESCSFISLLIEIQILYRIIDEIRTLKCDTRVEIFLPTLLPFQSIQKVSRRKWTARIYKIGDPRIFNVRLVHPQSHAQIALRVSPERTHRVGVFGFWALLICFFASSMELFLGIPFWFISRNWSLVKVYQQLVHWFVIRTH